MRDNRLKEQVLKNIREALMERDEHQQECECGTSSDNTFVAADIDDMSVYFAQNFTRRGGTMYYCHNETDISLRIKEIQHQHGDINICCGSENLVTFLENLDIQGACLSEPDKRFPLGATLCEALIAWQGSVVISSNQGLGATMPALTDSIVVLAFTSQVVADWETAYERMKLLYPEMPDQLMVTNPSSYAYRKGAQRIYLILIEDEDV